MKFVGKIFFAAVAMLSLSAWCAVAQNVVKEDTTATQASEQVAAEQDKEKSQEVIFDKDAPMMQFSGAPRLYHIRKVDVSGIEHIDKNQLRATAGLVPGDSIYMPSSYIANSITRLWSQRYFADVKVGATVEGDSLDLVIFLKERPRVYQWYFTGEGIGRSKQRDLMEQLKLKRGTELSDYVIDRNEKLIKKHFADKGFRNVEVNTIIENDSVIENAVNVTFDIKRNDKVKIGKITFSGNEQFDEKRLRKTFKKTHQKSINFLRSTKFKEEEYKEDKNLLLDFYNSRGYRNATIL